MERSLWRGLRKTDKRAYGLYMKEIRHQKNTLSLNANDNIVSVSVLEAASSLFVNSYPENYRSTRNLGRTKYHEEVEKMAVRRALRLFKLSTKKWCANVRLVSGTSANFVVFMALAGVGGKVMGIKQEMGGHHSFTFLPDRNQSTFQERIFDPLSYGVRNDGCIDYEAIKNAAIQNRPKVIIAGGYAISSDMDFRKIREIAQSVGAILLGDISHPSGLISHGLMNNPFKYCDVITTVMQKTMGGPRAGIIYCRKKYEQLINNAQTVLCGNSHTHIILQVAVALKEALSEGHYEMSKRIQSNARYLREILLGYRFNTYTTDSHMILIDMECAIKAYNFEVVADFLCISLDRVSLATHPCVYRPTGIRVGTTGITRRGMGEKEVERIVKILWSIKQYVDEDFNTKMLNYEKTSDEETGLVFDSRCLKAEELKMNPKLQRMKRMVEKITKRFPIPFFMPNSRNRCI